MDSMASQARLERKGSLMGQKVTCFKGDLLYLPDYSTPVLKLAVSPIVSALLHSNTNAPVLKICIYRILQNRGST